MQEKDDPLRNFRRLAKAMVAGYYQIISDTYPSSYSTKRELRHQRDIEDYVEIRKCFLEGNGAIWFWLAGMMHIYKWFYEWFENHETLDDSRKDYQKKLLQEKIYEDWRNNKK